MTKKYLPCLVAAILWVPYAWSAEPAAPNLPESIKTTLNQEYPGWKLASVNEEAKHALKAANAQHPPSVVWADFDNDGKRDYAVQIAFKQPDQEEQIIMVFLNRGDHFDEIIVQTQGLDPTIYLMTKKKTIPWVGPDGENHDVEMSVLGVQGSVIGDTFYIYQNGEFHELPPDITAPAVQTDTDKVE